MVDPFNDDNLDSSHILSRIGPSLRQHLCMKRRESELVVIAVLIRVWPRISIGFLLQRVTCVREDISVATRISVVVSEDNSYLLTNHLRPRRILIQQGTTAIVRQPAHSRKRNEKHGDKRNADTIKQDLSLEPHLALLRSPNRSLTAHRWRGPAMQRHSKWGPR